MHIYPNPASLIWTAISLVFIVYSTRALLLFGPALKEARNFTFNGKRKQLAIDLAKDYIIGESVRMLSHVLSATIGIQFMFVSPIHSPPVSHLRVVYSLEVIYVLIFLNVLSGVNSMRAVRSWNRRDVIVKGRNAENILQRLEQRRQRRDGQTLQEQTDDNTRRLDAIGDAAIATRQTSDGERLHDKQKGET